MVKRKMKQSQKVSDDESETPRPTKQLKKQKTSSIVSSVKNILFPHEVHNISRDSDIGNLSRTSGTAADDAQYESFSSFLKAFSYYCDESDNENQKSSSTPQKASNQHESSKIDNKRGKSSEEVFPSTSSFHENVLKEESDSIDPNIRIVPVPSALSELVLLQHPASVTLHGYVKVSVKLGNISIFGHNFKEGASCVVFSTEGTGLKKVVTLKPRHKVEIKSLTKDLKKLTRLETKMDLTGFMDDILPSSVLLHVEKILLPAPLQFLEQYYPTALQTRWVRSEASEKEKSFKLCSTEKEKSFKLCSTEKEKNFKLCSTENSYTIDISDDFKKLSKNINEVISKSVDAEFGHRILVRGEKNMGKSTLIRYLMNSALNKVSEVYFLDTDPGQTEYTPPGVVSLFRVTKPLLGPPFAHQKKPLNMYFTGSVSPATSPKLHEESVKCLVKNFTDHFVKKTLFVNTMGWVQGVGELCLEHTKNAVKPTIEIELVAPNPDLSLSSEVREDGVTVFKVPSKAPPLKSGAPSYSPVELRNFNLMAYLGQCQKSFMPLTLINSFHPVCVSWDEIALHVMGKKIPIHRLVEAIHCSIVALCEVDLSSVLENDNPDFPTTIVDEPLCKCLGFGLVRQSDETNRLFYIVTPLTVDQLKNVNALIKGNIMIPDEIFLKQTILNVPLPFTNHSKKAKTPGLKAVPKRAFRNTMTPNKTPRD